MSESIVIQVIIAASSIIVAFISLIATYINRKDVRAVKTEVKNNHGTNLRADLDKANLNAELAKNSSLRTEILVGDLDNTIKYFASSLKRHYKLGIKSSNNIKAEMADIKQKLDLHITEEVPATVKKVLDITTEMINEIEGKP